MPVDINNLSDGWLELESDPGLFTLLLENMGVKGVQVEEIYDLQKGFEGKVFGFIFLFKWIEERRSRRKIVENYDNYVRDESIVNGMFFAQQMVPNSCATHSLVSVLLNCSNLDLGPTLSRLRAHTVAMSPENKGWAIGNTPELANAHNSHAAPQARRRQDKTPGVPTSSRMSSAETFHFVSYVPINGHLFELDGLKPHPIDHGPWLEGEDWTEKFRRVITERLGIATGGEPYHDIRFNLMAVVPDKITASRQKLMALRRNRNTILEALHLFIQAKYPHYIGREKKPPDSNHQEYETSNNLSLLAVAASQKLESQGYAPNTSDAKAGCRPKEQPKEVEESPKMCQPPSEVDKPPRLNIGGGRIAACQSQDYATPLTIETSLALPATPSTDTASETGSAFNSPQLCSGGSSQSSPSVGNQYQRLVVVRMAPSIGPPTGQGRGPATTSTEDSAAATPSPFTNLKALTQQCEKKRASPLIPDGVAEVGAEDPRKDYGRTKGKSIEELFSKSVMKEESMLEDADPEDFEVTSNDGRPLEDQLEDEDLKKMTLKDMDVSEPMEALENGSFALSDLFRLVKIMTSEIEQTEILLKDELEKRKRYKIDDCRRTHNYDQFIITFLAMLAEQGKLGDLVKEQLQPSRKRPAPQPPNSRAKATLTKKVEPPKVSPGSNTNKKRGRKKKAKGKRKR